MVVARLGVIERRARVAQGQTCGPFVLLTLADEPLLGDVQLRLLRSGHFIAVRIAFGEWDEGDGEDEGFTVGGEEAYEVPESRQEVWGRGRPDLATVNKSKGERVTPSSNRFLSVMSERTILLLGVRWCV